MPTNIEKLAQELNAIIAEDENALDCTKAYISELPADQRIIMCHWYEPVLFDIKFDKILPYDPSGAPGTTNDVFAGAEISIDVNYGGALHPSKASAVKFSAHYSKFVRFALRDAAKAGKISSKILSEMQLKGPAPRDSLDPGTRSMLAKEAARAKIKAKRKK